MTEETQEQKVARFTKALTGPGSLPVGETRAQQKWREAGERVAALDAQAEVDEALVKKAKQRGPAAKALVGGLLARSRVSPEA